METFPSHPVLSLDGAKRFEADLFGGNEAKEWPAMRRAGTAIAGAVLDDYRELNRFRQNAHVLVLVGKGHNGGDALLAAQTILARHPEARADVWLVFGERSLRPLAARAYRELVHSAPKRIRIVSRINALPETYDLSIDGVFGFQFRPPLTPKITTLFSQLNRHPIRFRAAVDLPSGLGDADALRADFTYATGSVKTPVLDEAMRSVVGRLRYLDLGFFSGDSNAERALPSAPQMDSADRVLTTDALAPLRVLRPAVSDKRSYGHVFILGGSRSYPGAVLMSALAAARSGAGLITAFVPESLVPAYAAQAPEIIWVGWPETPNGGLALEGTHLLRERIERANALLIGPGIAREPETLALLADTVKTATVPLVIDADALQPDIVRAGSSPRILTPHAGEFARIAGSASLLDFSRATKVITVLKGPVTRISDGVAVYHSLHGGPVLARGGSGDILAGLIAGLLAQKPNEPLATACRGVVWHGSGADLLARANGQTAVQTLDRRCFGCHRLHVK